ncbi:hypothetical protein GCM10010520_55680 [Rhizobium viscosum]
MFEPLDLFDLADAFVSKEDDREDGRHRSEELQTQFGSDIEIDDDEIDEIEVRQSFNLDKIVARHSIKAVLQKQIAQLLAFDRIG